VVFDHQNRWRSIPVDPNLAKLIRNDALKRGARRENELRPAEADLFRDELQSDTHHPHESGKDCKNKQPFPPRNLSLRMCCQKQPAPDRQRDQPDPRRPDQPQRPPHRGRSERFPGTQLRHAERLSPSDLILERHRGEHTLIARWLVG